MIRSLFLHKVLTILVIACLPVSLSQFMGPADIIIKYTEKCKFTLPTLVDMNLLLYSRKGKLVMDSNATFPFSFSDEIGYKINMAVKKNGGWKQNFLQFHGDGICNIMKTIQPNLFNVLAKELKAPSPPKCPLPAGKFRILYSGLDPSAAMKKFGMDVLPYGEFRIETNVTHRGSVIFCCRCFVDLAPKKSKG